MNDIGPATFGLQFSGSGAAEERLAKYGFDMGGMRPYIDDETGHKVVTLNQRDGTQKTIILERSETLTNNDIVGTGYQGTLAYRDWVDLDQAIIRAARPRLAAFMGLRDAGLTYTIPNGMAKTVLQYQRISNVSPATVSMNGLRAGENDRPLYDLQALPLPIVHKDWEFDLRELMASRSGNNPIDTAMAELAGEKVAEQIEMMTLGTAASYTYGGGTIYGYTNFPQRITYSITQPTANGWTPLQTLNDILQMRLLSQQHFYFGPWMCYFSLAWDEWLDDDFNAAKGDITLRERIAKVRNIAGVQTLDFLPNYQILLVQFSSSVARAVIGMDIATVQWPTHGGMLTNFKVLCINVPQLRCDINGNTGIVHGS